MVCPSCSTWNQELPNPCSTQTPRSFPHQEPQGHTQASHQPGWKCLRIAGTQPNLPSHRTSWGILSMNLSLKKLTHQPFLTVKLGAKPQTSTATQERTGNFHSTPKPATLGAAGSITQLALSISPLVTVAGARRKTAFMNPQHQSICIAQERLQKAVASHSSNTQNLAGCSGRLRGHQATPWTMEAVPQLW